MSGKFVLLLNLLIVLLSSVLYVKFGVQTVSADYGVHNVNTGLGYSTIQEAIDANETLNGHMLEVDPGIREEHITIDKSLALVGSVSMENGEMTTIDGNGIGTVVAVKASNVLIVFLDIRNGVNGIMLDQAENVSIYGSRVQDNTGEGICLYNSRNCTLTNSYIGNNHHGFYLNSSSGNRFFLNSVVSNTFQVFSSNSTNAWDNAVKGNYWSDYLLRYPNATEIDSSGIGNTAYVIDTNNADRYPLINSPVIPELSQSSSLVLLTATMLAIIAYRRKHLI